MNNEVSKKSYWPIGIVVFFLVIATVNGSFLYLALTRKPANTSTAPYEDSLAFQDKLDGHDTTRQFFKPLLHGVCHANAACEISLRFKALGTVAAPNLIEVRLQQASTETNIIEQSFTASTDGSFLITHADLKPGLWLLEVTYAAADTPAFLRTRLQLR